MQHADAVMQGIIATDSLDCSESDSGDEVDITGQLAALSRLKFLKRAATDDGAAVPAAPPPTIALGAEFSDEAALRSAVAAFAASTQPPTKVRWMLPYASVADANHATLRCVCVEKERCRCRWAIQVPFVNDR